LTVIRAGNSFNYFAASTSRLSTQSSEGWYDLDPNYRVITQAPLKEGETHDLGQGDPMPASSEPTHQDPSLPWTDHIYTLERFKNEGSHWRVKGYTNRVEIKNLWLRTIFPLLTTIITAQYFIYPFL